MHREWPFLLFLFLPYENVLCESPHLFIFKAAVERAQISVQSEQARDLLAQQEYRRGSQLIHSHTISRDEFEQLRTAATVAALDVKIAEIKLRQQELALDLVNGLSQAHLRIPVCRRRFKKPKKELAALKRKPSSAPIKKDEPQTGTQVRLDQAVEPVQPPAPPQTPDLPEPTPAVTPPIKPPELEVPEIPVTPKPPPAGGGSGGGKPPKPSPGGGGRPPKPNPI